MKRPKRDPDREGRIHNEAIVDAGPEEQAMSWYYYLEGKISFPFRATCLSANVVSPLRKGETVEVLRMAAEDNCGHDMLVQIRWQGRKMAVPLSQLAAVDPDESTDEAIGDWHYWIRIIEGGHRAKLGYCPIPSVLHFNADWRKTPETQISHVTAAREIAASGSWWPAALKIPMPPGAREQVVFDELIRRDGYVDQLRRAVTRVVERLAWIQLDETPEIHLRLREALRQAQHELTVARAQLAASVTHAAELDQFIATQRDQAARKLADAATSPAVVAERSGEVASTSRRWTAPFRALRQLARRKG